jgi:hypothetical protein
MKVGGSNKMDLGETRWDDVDWIGLAYGRDKWKAFVNVVMNFSGSIKCCTMGGLLSSAQLHRVS